MKQETVEKIIKEIVPDSDIEVEGKECDFSVTIISEAFEGLSMMQRQQKILAGFRRYLADGSLHALSIKAFTQAEWNVKANHLVQISL